MSKIEKIKIVCRKCGSEKSLLEDCKSCEQIKNNYKSMIKYEKTNR